jgi:ketosteroid isomerase-like protein
MNNREIIEHFYSSFAKADAEGMVSCYAKDISFEDPAFGPLRGEDACNMWRMLVKPELKLTFDKVSAGDTKGSAHWIATYPFGKTGRIVTNDITASFIFRDGKIVTHKDHFDFWKWSRQALGLPGYLLGWTPFLRNKVRKQALERLEQFGRQKRAV